MNEQNLSVSFAIHDLNPWGGQDRSTLEIAKRVSRQIPVELYAFTIAGVEKTAWGKVKIHRLRPLISRPVIVKYNLYYGLTLLPFLTRKNLVHSTGTSSLFADIVQVQFVQAAWGERKKELSAPVGSVLKSAYHWGLTKYNMAMEKLIYSKDKHYIAISKAIKSELQVHFGIPESQISVIYHGVDADEFRPAQDTPKGRSERAEFREAYDIKPDDFVFLLVGALNDRKGIKECIEAFAKLGKEQREKALFMAVGNGDRALFERMAAENGVAHRVRIVSHQKKVNPFYSLADAFILPSHYEPFGLVILEAMACGLPTVVSKSAGGSELIEDGVSGLLIEDPKSADEIARLMAKLLDHRELAGDLGRNGRLVAEKHTWDRVAERYVEVIRKRWEREAK